MNWLFEAVGWGIAEGETLCDTTSLRNFRFVISYALNGAGGPSRCHVSQMSFY